MRLQMLAAAFLLFFSINLSATCNPAAGNPCPGWASASPATGRIPLTVTLNANPGHSGDANSPYSWQFDHWDFGDGNTATSLPAVHTYTMPGNYQATAYFQQFCSSCDPSGPTGIFETFSATVTVTSITSLSLTPATGTMMVGDQEWTLSLTDQNGVTVPGAFWSVDNTSVLSLSTDDPPLLTALTPGTATVMASADGITAQSIITVVPYGAGHHFPLGTVLWSLPIPAGFASQGMIKASQGSAASYIGVENDSSSHVVLRGISGDGQQMWQSSPLPVLSAIAPDGLGGALELDATGGKLTRVDGTTGAVAWQFAANVLYRGWASQDSTYIVKTVFDAPCLKFGQPFDSCSSHSYLLALNTATGSVTLSVPLPTGHWHMTEFGFVEQDWDAGATPGLVSILPDGTVEVQTTTQNDSLVVTSAPRGDNFYASSYQHTLYLTVLSPSGSATTTQMQSWTGGATCEGGVCNSPVGAYAPGETIPDGQGDSLAAWAFSDPVNGPVTHVTHFDATESQLADYTLPSVLVCSNGSCNSSAVILGENNTGFATDGNALVAFDVSSGAVKWGPWSPPLNHTVGLRAALEGGGVAVADQDYTTNPPTLLPARFDASGNLTYDSPWNSNGYVPNYTWPTLGVWVGVNASGYTQISQSEIVPAESVWGFVGGNPSGNRAPTGVVMESIPMWGVTTATAMDLTGCNLPIVVDGVTLPKAEPLTDTSVKENGKLLERLQQYQNQIITQHWITSKSCANYFSKLKDPNAMTYYAALQNAVQNQQWFNGHLSTISLYDAGAWETNYTPDNLNGMKLLPISCVELTPPTMVQQTQEGYDPRKHPFLGALSQIQPPANTAYYNGAALDYLTPSALVHEAFHNVTQKNDPHVRVILHINPPDDPQNLSTDDISLRLEREGCAPGR